MNAYRILVLRSKYPENGRRTNVLGPRLRNIRLTVVMDVVVVRAKPVAKVEGVFKKIWSFILSRLWYHYEGPSLKPPRSFEGRQEWSKKLDFLMACTGYAVGLGKQQRSSF